MADPHAPPRGTVTLLFSDIEGSTRLLARLRNEYDEVLEQYVRLVNEAAASVGGVEIDRSGDGLFLGFPTARGAVSAAISAQRALLEHRWPEGAEVHARIGLHTGEPRSSATRYVGLDVHRAARICAAGHGGQILLSQTVEALIHDDMPEEVSLHDLGTHRLKDLDEPVHLYQAWAPGLPADFPGLRTLDTLPNNLPRQLSSFVGRTEAVADARRRLDGCSLLTLTGPGGVGKTRMAVQVAAELLDGFPDGVWLVELEALAEPDLVVDTVASILRVSEQPGVPLAQTLKTTLGPRSLLLILDNCEHLLEAVADLVTELLRAVPNLRVLATSREALGVEGEVLYPVPSMELPEGGTAPFDRLASSEAVRLFAGRAAAVAPSFALTERNISAVSQICHRLDGIPLAIELAAARVKALSPEQIAARLDDRFRLLTGTTRSTLPRHRTLKAAMDWSHELLADEERIILRRLSVFVNGFTLEAAESVCGTDPLSANDVLDLLAHLVDKSLLAVDAEAEEARYRMLETVRDYAQERLVEAGEAAALHERHVGWCVAFVEAAKPAFFSGPEPGLWLQRVRREHDNLRTALRWSHEAGRPTDELRLAAGLWRYWEIGGHADEGRRWLEQMLERTGGEVSPLRANALTGAGVLASVQGDYEAARAFHEESLVLHRQLGSAHNVSYALNNLANVALEDGDLARAKDLYQECLTLARQGGDRRGVGYALANLADVVARQGEGHDAQALLDESVATFRSLRDHWGEAYAVAQYARSLEAGGAPEEAREQYRIALQIHRQADDSRGAARMLAALGDMALKDGDTSGAISMYRESLALRRSLGDRAGIAPTLDRLARASVASDPRWAAMLLASGEALRATIGAPLPAAERRDHDQTVDQARRALGEDPFRDAWSAGQSLPLDATLEEAGAAGDPVVPVV